MDNGTSSLVLPSAIGSNTGLDDCEAAALADIEQLDKEADDDLKNINWGIYGSGNEHESEDETDSESENDEDQERGLHADRSLVSEDDEYSSISAAIPKHQSYSEFENGEESRVSYNGAGKNSSFRDSHSLSNSHVSDENDCSSTTSQSSAKHTYPNENKSVSDAYENGEFNSGAPVNSAVSSERTVSMPELKEEYQKLYIIYKTTFDELTLLKAEGMNYKKETDKTIKALQLNLEIMESEKQTLTSNLQDSQNLISDHEHARNNLLGEVMSLKSQLSSMCKIKEEIQNKLESSEVTIQSLEKQLNELNRADHLSRLRDHHDSILEEMKRRHEKNILSFKIKIDELQSNLNSKVQEAKDLALKNSELERKYQQLEIEKAEWVNRMSKELEIAQQNCQQFLKSGTIEEIKCLNIRTQLLEKEKSNIEKENSLLKDEIKSLKAELDTAEALQKLTFSKRRLEEPATGQKDLNLLLELEKSSKNVRSLRSENHHLKKQLNNTETEMNNVKKKSQLFESQCLELEKKVKELEEKLFSLSSNESTTIQLYEKKIQDLEFELTNLKKNAYDASVSEKFLIQSNEDLQKKMTELIQKHMTDKIQAVKMCQEQLVKLHESALQKEKEKIQSKTDAELKDVCFKYENKISEMQKEIKALKEGLYDAKNQYIALYNENQSLQMKLDEISKPKEREDIEKEIYLEYEEKLTKLKSQFMKENKEYLSGIFKEELEKAQIEWTTQKMVDIKNFIENTKQRLNNEFQNCLQKEQAEFQKKLELEKERLNQEYEEAKANVKKRFEEERDKLTAIQDQDLQWRKKLNMLKERHENEIRYLQNQFDSKLLQMDNEIKDLKERLSVKADENEEVQRLKKDLILQQEKWQKEKDTLTQAETILNENLKSLTETQHKLHDKLKRYQRHVAAVKKHYKEKITTLQSALLDFQNSHDEKQNQLCLLQEKYEQEVLRKRNSSTNAVVQTEEEMVPKNKILNMEEKFFKCLMNISDGIRHYVNESKKRNAEKIQSALMYYHQQVSTKLIQDISKDVQSFTPTVIIPRSSAQVETASKETFEASSIPRNLYNEKFKTSTPANMYSTNQHFRQPEKIISQNDNVSSIPNFSSQTSVKSVYARPSTGSSQSRNGIQNLHIPSYQTPKLDIFNSGDSLLTGKVTSKNGLITDFISNHRNNKDCESVDRLEDISYDFLSLNFPSGLFGPSKMNCHRPEQGDYSKYADNYKDSLPVKLFPS